MVGDINLFLLSSDAAADLIASMALASDHTDGTKAVVPSTETGSNSQVGSVITGAGNSDSVSVSSSLLNVSESGGSWKIAEIDVMIAERVHWRKGFGSQAVGLILQYGVLELGIRYYASYSCPYIYKVSLFR